mmetsp:Transcript_10837/g.18331  ORF Transcript_10837/g.18331 Transcript_10837/m.18331 type:complete len:307 (-) Transcript_10837:36-956(-)|eukprot:CAMPEP_0116573218 /NCGR_PEP_ID=MMETSP0397-20121206/18655_1 /TAXON_ID=216820 /ORGANISM="Cyclophora tenuis, Strain ECT3854" /LENGTH=306 /DNA_ID=CAMNT_0004101725 /DNA_START=1 /DNA_END=921 /DNA_ORIENTATION=+
MTSWPWMKGIEEAIADPIPHVDEFDNRPSVKELINEHQKQIEKLRNEIEHDPLYEPDKHDDLWLLRFVMSHKKKKTKVAVEAAKQTLAFRKEHGLDEDDIRAFPPGVGPKTHPKGKAFKDYIELCNKDAINFSLPDPKRGVIGFLRIASINQHKLVEEFPEDQWLPSFLYLVEWCHQCLDYVTRTTGRLTKSMRIIDLDGLSFKAINSENLKRDGKAMGVTEDCYPQLLHAIYMFHAPSWMQLAWRIARPLLPKRVVEKIDIMGNPEKKRKREMNLLLQHISTENLPVRFGGQYEEWPAIFPAPRT